jgi:hypothetical protein
MRNKWIFLALLVSASVLAQKTPLHLEFYPHTGFFFAIGRWTPSDPKDKAGYPSQTEIDCDRQSKTCVEATAELISGSPHVSLIHLDVAKWNENGIIATSSNACMIETILISFPDKSISATYSMKKLDSDLKQACTIMNVSKPYTNLFVIEGSQRWIDELR